MEVSSVALDCRSNVAWFLRGGGDAGALLRAMDWKSHPLGQPSTWPSTVQATVAIILGSRQPMFLSWGLQHYTIYNDAYAEICGKRHPAAMGEPMSVTWYDIWDDVVGLVQRVHEGESIHMDDMEFVLHRNGYAEVAHFSFSYTPMRNEAGDILGVFCPCAETTQKIRLQHELEHERNLLAELFDHSPSFMAKLHGPDHVFEFINPSFVRLVGHRDMIGRSARDAFPEVASQGYFELLDCVRHKGEPVRVDTSPVMLQRTPNGPLEQRYIDFVFQPVRDLSRAVTGVLVEGVDVTDRVTSSLALQASEQFLRSVLGATPDCIKVLDLQGRLDFVSVGGRGILEMPKDFDIKGKSWTDLWADPEKSLVLKALDLAANGEPSGFQAYANTFAGNRRYWDVRVTPMLDANGRPERILAVSRDISYLKRIEEEREHLMHEVEHRLKNAFAMVQSVINQTLRKVTSIEEARDILSARIRALSDAQNILSRSITDNMSIQEVVEAALAPHRTGEGHFVISGPVCDISGKQGLGLSLALHELATNATKYGALSEGDGRVEINWTTDHAGDFIFDWRETGGPVVDQPQHRGFGTVLIEKIVASYFDGTASLEFLPEGVQFQLRGKIALLQDPDTPDPY